MDWLLKYKPLFDEVARKKYGMGIDFATIERGLARLRVGDILQYDDLEFIAREDLWPFKKYWIWPAREQIEDILEGATSLITDPLKNPEKELDMVIGLLEIFKNISLVSILLRFIWPEHYAIYSRPILWILGLERGRDDVEELMILIYHMRAMRNMLGVERTADVDLIIWAAAESTETNSELIKLIAPSIPVKEVSFRELLRKALNDPLEAARFFFDLEDYQTSGYWSSRAFEKYLHASCQKLLGFVPKSETREIGDLEFLISQICPEPETTPRKKLLITLKRLRNNAVHIEKRMNRAMAASFIQGIVDLNFF